jgi:hypothetical protein
MAGSASMPLEVIHAFVELDGGVMTAVVKVKHLTQRQQAAKLTT